MKDEDAQPIVSRLTDAEKQRVLEVIAVIVGDQLELEQFFAADRNTEGSTFSKADAYEHLRTYLLAYLPELNGTRAGVGCEG